MLMAVQYIVNVLNIAKLYVFKMVKMVNCYINFTTLKKDNTR